MQEGAALLSLLPTPALQSYTADLGLCITVKTQCPLAAPGIYRILPVVTLFCGTCYTMVSPCRHGDSHQGHVTWVTHRGLSTSFICPP